MLQVGQGAIVCGSNPNPKYASGPIIITPSLNRRAFLASCVTLLTTPQHVAAAEPQVNGWNPAPEDTIATTDPACASCVGYVDGTLGSCSAVDAPCASSYDDRPAHFVAPWQYDGSTASAMQQLVDTLEAFDASVQQQTADYVYAVLDQGPSGTSLDLEFVFAPNDTTVRLRGCCIAVCPQGAAGIHMRQSITEHAEGLSVYCIPAVDVRMVRLRLAGSPEQCNWCLIVTETICDGDSNPAAECMLARPF